MSRESIHAPRRGDAVSAPSIRALGILVACLFQLSLGCASPPDEIPERVGYPRARWRLAPQTLSHVALSASHILVRYSSSDPLLEAWLSAIPPVMGPAPNRTRYQAYELCSRIAAALVHSPDRFADLAKKHSDDATTSSRGGNLGIHRANQFPPLFLDALAALNEGAVSKVVESGQGFHIVRRNALAPEQVMALSEITIGYNGAPDLLAPLEHPVTRSRDEAKRMADDLYESLIGGRTTFDSAVSMFSDAESALRGGDIGVWSTHEPSQLGRELAALSSVGESAISPPIASGAGFRILRRGKPVPRETIQVEQIVITHGDPSEPARGAPTQAEARALAERIIVEIQLDPSAFDRYRQSICCKTIASWMAGRASAPFEAEAQGLQLGEYSAAPLHWRSAYFILKRVIPDKVLYPEAGTATLTELPAPTTAALNEIAAVADGPAMAAALQGFASSSTELGLSSDSARRLTSLLDELADELRRSAGDTAPEIVESSWRKIEETLSKDDLQRFRSALSAWTDRYLMAMW